MTKTVEAWDNLHIAEDEEKVPAVRQDVEVKLGSRVKLLDLTEEHYIELEKFLERYFAAGEDPAGTSPVMRQPQAAAPKDQGGKAVSRPIGDEAVRFEEWCDRFDKRHPKTGQRAYMTPAGQKYYPAWAIREFRAWEQAERDGMIQPRLIA